MRPGQQNSAAAGVTTTIITTITITTITTARVAIPDEDLRQFGSDVKIRGTAQHIAEKYSALARDAQSAGDRVMAENYLQHAEHYNRIIAAAQAQMQERFPRMSVRTMPSGPTLMTAMVSTGIPTNSIRARR